MGERGGLTLDNLDWEGLSQPGQSVHANFVAIILLINNQVHNISEGGEEGGLTL